MIPGKIFTGFAKFQGIVSVNDFRLPRRLQELLQALLRFLRSFCFYTGMIVSTVLPSLVPPHAQLNCRTPFTTATALFFTLFRLFVWLFFDLPVRKRALSAELTSRFRFVELTTFGMMPILTRRFGASTFQEAFTRRPTEFHRLASASGISFSRHTSTSCFCGLWLRGWFGFQCRFRTIGTLMPEHWSPFEHCRFPFHW